ncbi:serine hydrolase domain-containing protein [Aquimarina rhabdastrellae]
MTLRHLVAFFLCLSLTITGQAQQLEHKIDSLLHSNFSTTAPGVAILVAKKGEIIYNKAIGMSDLELDISLAPKHVFKIGSITKQFTAVSILMLQEQQKLNVIDVITKYLPDYPIQDKNITIHQLLTHTSGIKNYTRLNMDSIQHKDLSPLALIDFFKNEPTNFDPGQRYSYSNSGYVILGYIIEKVSGQSYEDFIEEHIFKKLGMSNSYYTNNYEIIKNKTKGYLKRDKNTYIHPPHFSHTIPYAAGSLLSTVEDLYTWQKAITNHTLLSPSSTQQAFTNYTTTTGTPIHYGYGWHINEINGSTTIEHSGGIFGFISNAIYLPQEDVYVAMLSNCSCNLPITTTSTQIAALAINKPFPELKNTVKLTNKELQKWVGTYTFTDGTIRIISREGNQLYSQLKGKDKLAIYPISKNTFIFKELLYTIIFKKDKKGVSYTFKNRVESEIGIKK